MDFGEGTVFVLGAGFTKAFLPDAPLLIDDFGAEDLKAKFVNFKTAKTVLKLEIEHPDHERGKINLERLMTRLAGGMPYDVGRKGADRELQMLLYELKRAFLQRLSEAKEGQRANSGELRLFAGHCLKQKLDCITFNYDDILDEALWKFWARHSPESAWSPDWGYGFPCRMSEACVRSLTLPEPNSNQKANSNEQEKSETAAPAETSPMLLLKLHGSVNWRMALGQTKPFSVDAIRHHEEWFTYYGQSKFPLENIEPFLEAESFFVPPILTKTDVVEQPVFRLIWTLALKRLRKAKRVIFLGYSLPITDLGAGFLFREGLRGLNHAGNITIVDFAENGKDRQAKLDQLFSAYRNVFPEITEEQFCFCGAAEWIRNNFTEWLYDSKGKPIAFRALDCIVSRAGRFIGTIRGHKHGSFDVWHNSYKGEIIDGNRFLYKEPEPSENRGGTEPDFLPGVPRIPGQIDSINLPSGFRDVLLDV